MADETIRNALATDATSPRKVKGDEGEVEQHPLKDKVEADQYLRGQTGAAKAHRGLRFNKLVPPGATGV